jgi:DnaJ like chaperone protein
MLPIILIILVVLYLLNPYDIIPDLLVGWGWLDDIIIIGFLIHFLNKRRKNRAASQQRQDQHRGADPGREEYAGNRHSHHDNPTENGAVRDPYRILGIEKGAPQETIKQAYRELAGKYHPDKVEYLGDEFKALAEKRFKEIQQAYEELKRD